jgi:hypothetical protein
MSNIIFTKVFFDFNVNENVDFYKIIFPRVVTLL